MIIAKKRKWVTLLSQCWNKRVVLAHLNKIFCKYQVYFAVVRSQYQHRSVKLISDRPRTSACIQPIQPSFTLNQCGRWGLRHGRNTETFASVIPCYKGGRRGFYAWMCRIRNCHSWMIRLYNRNTGRRRKLPTHIKIQHIRSFLAPEVANQHIQKQDVLSHRPAITGSVGENEGNVNVPKGLVSSDRPNR